MDGHYIDAFLQKYDGYFSEADLPTVKRMLLDLPDEYAAKVDGIQGLKKPSTTLLIAIFLGLDRFYLKDYVLGVLKVFLYWIIIWPLIDIFTAKKRAYAYNMRVLYQVLTGETVDKKMSSNEIRDLGLKILPVLVQGAKEVRGAAKGFGDSLYASEYERSRRH